MAFNNMKNTFCGDSKQFNNGVMSFNNNNTKNEISGKGCSFVEINDTVINNPDPNGKFKITIKWEGAEKAYFVCRSSLDITINGSCENTNTVNGSVRIKKNAKDVKSTNGDIIVEGDVNGNCKTVNGDIISSGNISGKCSTVHGKIKGKKKKRSK